MIDFKCDIDMGVSSDAVGVEVVIKITDLIQFFKNIPENFQCQRSENLRLTLLRKRFAKLNLDSMFAHLITNLLAPDESCSLQYSNQTFTLHLHQSAANFRNFTAKRYRFFFKNVLEDSRYDGIRVLLSPKTEIPESIKHLGIILEPKKDYAVVLNLPHGEYLVEDDFLYLRSLQPWSDCRGWTNCSSLAQVIKITSQNTLVDHYHNCNLVSQFIEKSKTAKA